MSFPDSIEVVVVGSGMIGLSIACELERRGKRVLVLDREGPGGGATDASAGLLAPASEVDLEEEVLVRYALSSLGRYPAWIEELEKESGITCGYRSEGTLWVAVNRDEDLELENLKRIQEAKGVTSTRLTGKEVLERESLITPRAVGGLWIPGDHSVDPRRLTAALAHAIQERGGGIVAGCHVEDVHRNGGVWSVDGHRGGAPFSLACKEVVLAAGAWSTADIRSPLEDVEVRPVKGQLLRLHGPDQVRHNIRTPRVYIVPRQDGELLVGATMEEMGFDDTATGGGVMDLLRHGWLTLPGIYDLELAEVSIGLRPAVRDHLPVIDRAADDFFVALGHFRNGILLAPATGQDVAEWMTTGTPPDGLTPFGLNRLAKTT